MSAIKRFQDSETMLEHYVTLGDTINGHPIIEIWVTSLGSPRFVIGGDEQYVTTHHYSFDELLLLAPAGEKKDYE